MSLNFQSKISRNKEILSIKYNKILLNKKIKCLEYKNIVYILS